MNVIIFLTSQHIGVINRIMIIFEDINKCDKINVIDYIPNNYQ